MAANKKPLYKYKQERSKRFQLAKESYRINEGIKKGQPLKGFKSSFEYAEYIDFRDKSIKNENRQRNKRKANKEKKELTNSIISQIEQDAYIFKGDKNAPGNIYKSSIISSADPFWELANNRNAEYLTAFEVSDGFSRFYGIKNPKKVWVADVDNEIKVFSNKEGFNNYMKNEFESIMQELKTTKNADGDGYFSGIVDFISGLYKDIEVNIFKVFTSPKNLEMEII